MSNNFCSIPWDTLYIHPNGEVRTCCHGTENLGNINDANINDILHNTQYEKIRKDILKDRLPKNCVACKMLEKSGQITLRTTRSYPKEVVEENANQFVLKSVDIRWDNTCNLSCIYCNGEFSSSWQKIDGTERLKKNNKNIKAFEDYIIDNKDTITKVHLVGGEPLLLKHHVELLKNFNDDIDITVTSNLSIPNLRDNKVLKELLKKQNVKWRISFDNLNEKFEYVRHGAEWKVFYENLLFLKSIQNHKITAVPTYHALSALDVIEFYSFCYNMEIDVKWHGLVYPTELHVHKLPTKYKNMCFDRLTQAIEAYPIYDSESVQNTLKLLKFKQNGDANLDYLTNYLSEQERKLNKKIKFNELWNELNG